MLNLDRNAMKLFTTKQIAGLDKYTIEHEPVSDIDLMERAALQITHWVLKHFSNERKMIFFAGPGNNGGDALAIARQLADLDFICEVYLSTFGKSLSGSPEFNLSRLNEQGKVKNSFLNTIDDFPELGPTDVLVDGLFGSGLTRSLSGFTAKLVQKINQTANTVIAIDIPSGLMGENNTDNNPESIIKADYTLTFQFPKISFLFAENEKYIGRFEVLPIRLHPDGMEKTNTVFYYLEEKEIGKSFCDRSKFSHKGTFGHALLIAGSYGKMGAAVLASKACLRSGAGLLTTHIPRLGYPVLQTAVPEAMCSVDAHDSIFTEFPDPASFSAIGIGPGLDKKNNSRKAFSELLKKTVKPMVIDADALNILSENKEWLDQLPPFSILTPHPGEFIRLAGESANSYDQLQKQILFSEKYKVIVVLKGAFTQISTPAGKVYFNSTGNPGMATAGSGDALTGVILGLLTRGFSPERAALTGVYVHGLSGDLAAAKKSETALLAGDIIEFLGKAFLRLERFSTK